MEHSETRLALNAMGTRFELLMWGDAPTRLRAAGQEALQEIERLEEQLSLYREESDLSEINRLAATTPVRTDPRLFRLLQQAAQLTELTDGAFDITISPLVRLWGFQGGEMQTPDEDAIATALSVVGMHNIRLNSDDFTVQFDIPGVHLDLGSIGKGYAVDCATAILMENGVKNFLLHGGTSSVAGFGTAPNGSPWKVALRQPFSEAEDEYLASVELADRFLSVSAPHGKWFEQQGQRFGHILDPLTGYPVDTALLTAVVGESATIGDALTTGLLTLGVPFLTVLPERFPATSALLLTANSLNPEVITAGEEIWKLPQNQTGMVE